MVSIKTAQRRIDQLAVALLLGLVVFYANRIFMPLPLYAADEANYLINAEHLGAWDRNPFLARISNSVWLAVLDAVRSLTDYDLYWLRALNLASYLGAILIAYRAFTPGLGEAERRVFLLIAVAIPYYRFLVTALPEGLYVLIAVLVVVVAMRGYGRRPALSALAVGVGAAILALVKPHGITFLAAFVALNALDVVLGRRFIRPAMRVACALVGFFVGGNLLQMALGQPVGNPLLFFVGDIYSTALRRPPPPDAAWLGVLCAAAMGSATLLLAGPPVFASLDELARRWRRRETDSPFELRPAEIAFLLLLFALLATIVMVSIFAMKVAFDPGETKRLWGRYFEFFVPLLWLASARTGLSEEGGPTRRLRVASAATLLIGLAGLLLCFRAGVVLFPWDATALTAFVYPDAARAPVGFPTFRTAMICATIAAAAACVVWRAMFLRVWLGYILALAVVSTAIDHMWMGPMVDRREVFAREMTAAASHLTPDRDRVAVITADGNDAQLSFLTLEAAATVLLPKGAVTAPQLAPFDKVLVLAPRTDRFGDWRPVYQGVWVTVLERVPPDGEGPGSAR